MLCREFPNFSPSVGWEEQRLRDSERSTLAGGGGRWDDGALVPYTACSPAVVVCSWWRPAACYCSSLPITVHQQAITPYLVSTDGPVQLHSEVHHCPRVNDSKGEFFQALPTASAQLLSNGLMNNAIPSCDQCLPPEFAGLEITPLYAASCDHYLRAML